MTDENVGPDTEAEGWSVQSDEHVVNVLPAVTYPEFGPLPEAPLSVNFTPGRPPQLTVRAHTGSHLQSVLRDLMEDGTIAVVGEAHTMLGAQAAVGAGLGPTTPVPPAPPAPSAAAQAVAAAYPTPAPVPPAAPQGPAPAAWQQAGAPSAPAPQGAGQDRFAPKPRPNWPQVYKITVPRGDNSFKDYRAANQQFFKGKVLFAGNGQYWVAGDVAPSLQNWNPVPA